MSIAFPIFDRANLFITLRHWSSVLTAEIADLNGLKNLRQKETKSGKMWVDGSPIFTKTINLGTLPDTTTKLVPHGIAGFTRIVNIYGTAQRDSDTVVTPLPYVKTTALSGGINLFVDATNVSITTGAGWADFNGYITLEYLK